MLTQRAACLALLAFAAAALQGCASPRQLLLDGVADALSAQGAAEEDDLALARDAAPFYLKVSEAVLRQTPGHRELAEAVAAGYTQYAYAFVAFDADRLEENDARAAQRQRERAARLYRRAQRHALAALERAQPGLLAHGAGTAAAPALGRQNVGLAYWAAASWAAAISLSKDSPEAVAELPQAVALARAAYAAQPDHAAGALATLMGTLEAARPGGARAQAQAYFERALAAAGAGGSAPVHLAMAEALAQPQGDRERFEQLLRLAVQAAAARNDLPSRVAADRAEWLLSRIDDLF